MIRGVGGEKMGGIKGWIRSKHIIENPLVILTIKYLLNSNTFQCCCYCGQVGIICLWASTVKSGKATYVLLPASSAAEGTLCDLFQTNEILPGHLQRGFEGCHYLIEVTEMLKLSLAIIQLPPRQSSRWERKQSSCNPEEKATGVHRVRVWHFLTTRLPAMAAAVYHAFT